MNKYKIGYGVLLGLVQIAWVAGVYAYNSTLLLNGWELYNWLFALVFLIFIGRRYRDAQGPPLPLHTRELLLPQAPKLEAFVSSRKLLGLLFPVFTLGYLLKFAFIYVLFYYIDPQLLDMAQDKAVRIFVENRDPQQSETLFQQSLEAFKAQDFGPGFDLLGISIMLLLGFLISVLLSQLFKRPRPELS